MEKKLLSFITLFTMCLLFSLTSCDKDDNGGIDDEGDLIGSWIMIAAKGDYEGEKFDKDWDIEEETEGFIFKNDGSFRSFETYYDGKGNKKYDYEDGEWELNGNKIILYDKYNETSVAKITKLTKSRLVIFYEDEDGYIESTYAKVD